MIYYDQENKELVIDVKKSSLDKSIVYHKYTQNYKGKYNTPKASENREITSQKAPFVLDQGESLDLRIFIDRTIIEVFVNERECLTQRIYPTRPDSLGIELFSAGGEAEVSTMKSWNMNPIVITNK